MKKELVAVILAGGAGNRFWPLTANKILFPYMGKPLIGHAAITPLPREVERVVVVTSAQNNTEIASLSFPVPSIAVVQKQAHGMADAILSAQSEIGGCSLLIVNGDDVSDPEMLTEVVKSAEASGCFGIIPGWTPAHYMPIGYLKLNGHRVTQIVEKPGEGNEPSGFANILGHYIADSDVLIEELKRTTSEFDDVYERAISELMKHDVFRLYSYKGGFATLKYPWHVLDVMNELLKRLKPHRGKNVEIRSNVIIEGAVYLEDDVRIFENTKIIGPCYVGKGTIVGNNNIIRASHIGAKCVTGFNTDITRSYIGDSCWFHSNYVGDSVIEKDVSIGSGTILANLRFDEGHIHSVVKEERINSRKNKFGAIIGAHTRLGINASIMPGVKIGSRSLIGAGVVLDRDVPDESYSVSNAAVTVVKNTTLIHASRDTFRDKL